MSFVAELEPHALWQHFDELLTIPRPSKHEERARRYVIGVADSRGLRHREDAVGNVVVEKPALPEHRERSCTEPQAEGVEMMVERRLRVVIPEDHRVVVEIPEDVPAGPAELILMVEQPGGGEAGDNAVSKSAKERFESLADELAAARPFRDLSQEERKARLRRVVGIGRELFSPSEEVARRKEEQIETEERRFGR